MSYDPSDGSYGGGYRKLGTEQYFMTATERAARNAKAQAEADGRYKDPVSAEVADLLRRRDQELVMARLARQDGDAADELLHTTKARDYAVQIGELLRKD